MTPLLTQSQLGISLLATGLLWLSHSEYIPVGVDDVLLLAALSGESLRFGDRRGLALQGELALQGGKDLILSLPQGCKPRRKTLTS